jgi:hypothetical protein
MDEVKTLVGQEEFNRAVADFDEMNRQVIELYEHKARSLEGYLQPRERGLITDLIGLPSILYYRRAK